MELELDLNNKDFTALRKVLTGSNKVNMTSLKALRLITAQATNLSFVPKVFPELRVLSIRIHGLAYSAGKNRSSMRGWATARLGSFKTLERLETVQLWKDLWRELDLRGMYLS